MNEPQKFCLSCPPRKEPIPDDGHPFCSSCTEAGWDTAFRRGAAHGRESVLRAAQDLSCVSANWLAERAVGAAKAQQATDTVKALGDWCAMSPEVNYYTVEETKKLDPLKRWMTILHHKKDPETEMSRTLIYGSTHADCLAKGAQWCLLEIRRWAK
jgi:predicted amidophosphoribosyltransferase